MSNAERNWRRRAGQVARRVNAGWFLQKAAPFLIGGGLAYSIVVLCLRTLKPEWWSLPWLGGAGLGLLGAFLVLAFLLSRKEFIDTEEGLVRLEDRLSMNNSLSAAAAGVGEWPRDEMGEDGAARAGLAWNVPAALLPMLTSVILVLAAFFVPIPDLSAKSAPLPPNEPGAWEQMEEWLTALEEEELIEESALEEVREKIRELRDQPEDEWFSHSSMEATDSMRESLARDLREAATDMQMLERDLAALESYSGQMSEAAREMLMKEYDEALKNLGLNGMKLNQELMDQLKDVDISQISQAQMGELTREQLQQLRERLKSGCD